MQKKRGIKEQVDSDRVAGFESRSKLRRAEEARIGAALERARETQVIQGRPELSPKLLSFGMRGPAKINRGWSFMRIGCSTR